MSTPLWTVEAMAQAMGAQPHGAQPADVPGLSIDTRTIAPGEAFFALKDVRDGHDFVEAALKAGGGLAVVAASKRGMFPKDAPLLVVTDVLEGLTALARAARARSHAKFIGVTGSVARPAPRRRSSSRCRATARRMLRRVLQQPLGGAAVAGALPGERALRGARNGMNHAGEIAPLTKLVRPHVAIITTIEPCISNSSPRSKPSPMPRRKSLKASSRAAPRVINRDNPHFARLQKQAKPRTSAHRQLRRECRADARLLKFALQADFVDRAGGASSAPISPTSLARRPPCRDEFAGRACAASLAGADLALAALALSNLKPPSGGRRRADRARPARRRGAADRRKLHANPASMRAALALLGQAAVGPRGRRIAVLGEMLELGPLGAELHRGLAQSVVDNSVDLVFCAGSLYRASGKPFPRTPGRLCVDSRGARSRSARRVARGRRGDGQGLARLEDGPHRQGAHPSVRVARRREAVSAQG